MGWLFIPALLRGGPKPEKISPTYVRRSLLIFVVVLAVFIVAGRSDPGIFLIRFVPDSDLTGMTGVAFTILGLGFSAYARLSLGRNWSSLVMIREGHQLVRTGPYRFVRNPMYTGMLTAFIGAVIAIGMLAALAALAILVVSLWMKIMAEEELLREKFGEEFLRYKREVRAAIIPWVV
ncbi:MAG TPA: isoprenylcysteine carboxylmethyltransferase family protein [Methanoregula sp.]|nr:isoprenylcysteine carboxylmethyltransferase family protein [Methanoregula sp.]